MHNMNNILRSIPVSLLSGLMVSGRGAARRVCTATVRRAVLMFLGAGMCAFIVPVSGAGAQTLQEALVTVYNSNPLLQLRRAELEASNESVAQALSRFNPNVVFEASTGRISRSQSFRIQPDTHNKLNRLSAELEITQLIYDGGRSQAGVSATEKQVIANRHTLAIVENSVLVDAATAYYDVLLQQSVVNLNVQNVARLGQAMQATRDRFDVGEVTLTDVAQARARLARAQAELVDARSNLEIAQAAYLQAVGEAPGTLILPRILVPIPTTLQQAIDTAIATSPNVRRNNSELEVSRLLLLRAKGDLRPTINLQGAVSAVHDNTFEDDRLRAASLLGVMTFPLYQQGLVSSQIREAQGNITIAQRQLAQTIREVSNGITNSWAQLQSVQAQVESLELEVESSLVALEGVQEESRVGLRTVLDVLDAEQAYLDAQVRYEFANRNLAVTRIEIAGQLGTFTADTLQLDTPLYNPDIHYNAVRDAVTLWRRR